tara:strand:- start:1224 stop:1751 length:528 start_codon:yes stop_codon:yes gene_type:complete
MNKFFTIISILFFSSCHIFNIKQSTFKTALDDISIYADVKIDQSPLNELKLKTKIILSKDSILISAYPIMGLKLAEILIKNNAIWIDQKILNKTDSILISSIDPDFTLKTLINMFVQPKLRQDTMFYENSYIGSIFTKYQYVDNLFLPSNIIYWEQNKKDFKKTIYINYKSVKHR